MPPTIAVDEAFELDSLESDGVEDEDNIGEGPEVESMGEASGRIQRVLFEFGTWGEVHGTQR
jgi:hypothetical protein